MSDETLPIVGLPLAVDSLEQNGVLPFVADLLGGVDVDVAIQKIRQSEAAKDPVSFVVGEWFKWKLYKGVKTNTVVNIMGFELGL